MSDLRTVAVLFARRDSVYKTLPGTDVWDEDRDALKWPGGAPVVAHPPCRLWGGLSHFSSAPISEKFLAIWSVRQIRTYGGVLEHPSTSRLFSKTALAPDWPLPIGGERDSFGGFTVKMPQWWFGHKAEKMSYFYVCGINAKDLPDIALKLGEAEWVVKSALGLKRSLERGEKPQITKPEREHTPVALAEWLLETARRCNPPKP